MPVVSLLSLTCCGVILSYTLPATANTLSFCLASLAYHPDTQEKARKEVQQVLAANSGDFSYEMLKQLPFIWQIFREALRLFPTVPVFVSSPL